MSTTMTENPKMQTPKIVSQEEWLAAHEQLLADEKRLTRARRAVEKAMHLLEEPDDHD